MRHYQEVSCPDCDSNKIMKPGRSVNETQPYRCQHPDCTTRTFMMPYSYKAYEAGTKEQIIEIAIKMVVESVLLVEGLGKGKLKLLNLGTK